VVVNGGGDEAICAVVFLILLYWKRIVGMVILPGTCKE